MSGRLAHHRLEVRHLLGRGEVDHGARTRERRLGESRRRHEEKIARGGGQDAGIRTAVVADPDRRGTPGGVVAGAFLRFEQDGAATRGREMRGGGRAGDAGPDDEGVGRVDIGHARHRHSRGCNQQASGYRLRNARESRVDRPTMPVTYSRPPHVLPREPAKKGRHLSVPPSLGRKRPSKQQTVKPPRCCDAQTRLGRAPVQGLLMALARVFVCAVDHSCRERRAPRTAPTPRHVFRSPLPPSPNRAKLSPGGGFRPLA